MLLTSSWSLQKRSESTLGSFALQELIENLTVTLSKLLSTYPSHPLTCSVVSGCEELLHSSEVRLQ